MNPILINYKLIFVLCIGFIPLQGYPSARETNLKDSSYLNAHKRPLLFKSNLSSDTIYYPFTALGFTIINQILLANSSVSITGNLISATNGQAVDIEQSYFESDDPDISAMINASGATTQTSIKILNNIFKANNHVNYTVEIGYDAPPIVTGCYNGAQFIGNLLTGAGSRLASSSAHGFMLGFSSRGKWLYNFIINNPYGCQTKSDGLNNTGAVISYNLIKNPKYGITIKGMSNTTVINNTIYMDHSVLNYATGITVSEYDDGSHPSTGTIIKNNIIYSAGKSPFMIQIDDFGSLTGLQCDYNVYYVSGGTPEFIYVNSDGKTKYASFSQWQALGYDTHSVVINPKLNATTLVPAQAINYAIGLGTTFNTGINPSNTWDRNHTITKVQGSIWQNGAFILESSLESNP